MPSAAPGCCNGFVFLKQPRRRRRGCFETAMPLVRKLRCAPDTPPAGCTLPYAVTWFRCRLVPMLPDVASTPPSQSTDREPIYHVRDLTRIYGDGSAGVTALAGVDFDLFAGELIVLLGASGSGKSTLLNQLGGLDSPTSRKALAPP